MPDAITAYLPHALGLAAMGYLIAKGLRSWRIRRTGRGPACGGGCPSCDASRPTPNAARFHDEKPSAASASRNEAASGNAYVPLRLRRRV